MHKLAQYVFGSGRQQLENPLTNQQLLEDNNKDCNNPKSSFHENESNNCSLINIENDWILIDVDGVQPTSTSSTNSDAAKSKSKQQQQHSGNKKSIHNSSKQRKKFAQFGNTTQECSKIDEQPDLNRAAAAGDDGAGVGGGIKNDSNETNLLIEQPSMSVFDNLFVKKPPPTNANTVTVAVSASSPAQPTPSLNKAEQRKLIISKIQQSTSYKNGSGNTVNGNKENQSNNKMKKTKSNRIIDHVPTASSSASLAIGGGNKNDFTAIVEKDKIIRKVNISKKRHRRQNKVATNRNGPMIRQKKMFVHINGVLNNRNSC